MITQLYTKVSVKGTSNRMRSHNVTVAILEYLYQRYGLETFKALELNWNKKFQSQ